MLVSCALGHSPTTAAFNSSLLENRCHPLSAAKGFQLATAQAALQTLSADDGPRRFLVADEVGLGKTVVARGPHIRSPRERCRFRRTPGTETATFGR